MQECDQAKEPRPAKQKEVTHYQLRLATARGATLADEREASQRVDHSPRIQNCLFRPELVQPYTYRALDRTIRSLLIQRR
jgi:hypothetical protein